MTKSISRDFILIEGRFTQRNKDTEVHSDEKAFDAHWIIGIITPGLSPGLSK